MAAWRHAGDSTTASSPASNARAQSSCWARAACSKLWQSGTQNARVWSEQWVNTWLFCPNCGAQNLKGYERNRPVADFHCAACAEEFELGPIHIQGIHADFDA
jgi:hypothetical protein